MTQGYPDKGWGQLKVSSHLKGVFFSLPWCLADFYIFYRRLLRLYILQIVVVQTVIQHTCFLQHCITQKENLYHTCKTLHFDSSARVAAYQR